MKVVVDDKIPYINVAIETIADEVVYMPGAAFNSEIVRDADALIVRTRTLCNRSLLEGSKVKFIATATIGFDHIDVPYCRQAGIIWKNAPGCNAAAVGQYIRSVLLLLKTVKEKDLKQLTLGIIGVGNVGRNVMKVAKELGMRVLLNDPPREFNEGEKSFVSLEKIKKECDVITFHVPLNSDGEYKTYHLADTSFFDSLERCPVIINTSRGSVIETNALLHALNNNLISDAVIDVWENEPNINLALLDKVMIGTSHIAGYSADGKANATRMALHSLCQYFGLEENFNILPPSPVQTDIIASSYDDAYLKIYDPRQDSIFLKKHPESFESYRGNYPLRREPKAYQITITSK